MESHF